MTTRPKINPPRLLPCQCDEDVRPKASALSYLIVSSCLLQSSSITIQSYTTFISSCVFVSVEVDVVVAYNKEGSYTMQVSSTSSCILQHSSLFAKLKKEADPSLVNVEY